MINRFLQLTLVFFVLFTALLFAQDVAVSPVLPPSVVPTMLVSNLAYYGEKELATADDYQKKQCQLDILYPKDSQGYATLVWFHGGGLTAGSRGFPSAFKKTKLYQEGKLALVAVGYRLSPQVDYPVFIQDAAASVAWIIRHITEYGGDPAKIFVSGGSAGGYLTAMIGMDNQWLAANGIDHLSLAGLLPVSGQMTTHFNVKKMLNIPCEQYQPVIDKNAPLFYCSKNIPPIYLIVGDRKIEWKARVEENELLYASLRALEHSLVEFSESPHWGHEISGMGDKTPDEVILRVNSFIEKALEMKYFVKQPNIQYLSNYPNSQ